MGELAISGPDTQCLLKDVLDLNIPCFLREAHPVESDHHCSTKTDVVLQGDLCPGNLPRPRLPPQLPAQLCTLSQT